MPVSLLMECMSESEIARELGVNDKVVKWIRSEIEKDV